MGLYDYIIENIVVTKKCFDFIWLDGNFSNYFLTQPPLYFYLDGSINSTTSNSLGQFTSC